MRSFVRLMVMSTVAAMVMTGTAQAQGTDASSQSTSAPCAQAELKHARADKADIEYDYIYDVSTGQARGKTRFKRTDTVQIIVTNINPFRYSYSLTSKDQEVKEPAIAELLASIELPLPGKVVKPGDKDAAEKGGKAAMAVTTLTPADLATVGQAWMY
jgi:hypothetical protein